MATTELLFLLRLLHPFGRLAPYLLRPVACCHTSGVKYTTDDVIADTRQVFYTTTANHHHRVFLQVVTLARNICGNFNTIGQADAGYFSLCRVRFFRRYYPHAGANSAFQWSLSSHVATLIGIECQPSAQRTVAAL